MTSSIVETVDDVTGGLISFFIGAAAAVYLAATISLKSITIKDMELIPGGEKIGKILKMH